MTSPAAPAFAGSIPENYHRILGPILFETYARDMAARVSALKLPAGARVLEIAAGSGIVTKALMGAMPARSALVATDLSEPMLAIARTFVPADPRLTFSQADGCALPFKDREFDAIVCQYGVMFFPDKVKAMQEARRVLKPGGTYLFNVWDSLERNPIAAAVQAELDAMYPQNPPSFLRKMPFGWFDRAEIERVVRAGGFQHVKLTDVTAECVAADAEKAARAFVTGTPVAADLAERKADIEAVVARVAGVLGARFGKSPCRAVMSAVVVEAR
jgi:ubiquinone/menaquinone biosynthesis C-methylase UbiE